jgi:hypothetical protein
VLLRLARSRGDRGEQSLRQPARFPVDGAIVPGLLLLVARDLVAHDPPRVLAWRLLHDERLAASFAWLGPLFPAPSGVLDRDPIALALAGLATLLALAYAGLAARGARPRARAGVLAAAAFALVVLPTAALVAMGAASGRPYGQDGGVVQLPLAIDRILAGDSPYAADYSGTILARQARVSSFWDERGGNPILRHHAYLPGTHLVMLPFHLASRALFGSFDPRVVTILFWAAAILLASRLPSSPDTRLAAAAAVAVNPLVYWQQAFGANDVVFVAMLLGVVLLARQERRTAAGALLGLACATKQLAWPYAPFLLLALSDARALRELLRRPAWQRLARPLAAAAAVFLAVVLPVAALDLRAFWSDIVAYNVGLPGADNYPLGGTPGFGFANLLVYFGRVASLRDYFPFSVFYVLLVPLGVLLARVQAHSERPEWALATGSAALVASVYFSRVVHPNYLIPAAVLLPVAVLAVRRHPALAIAPPMLFLAAVEIVESELFRAAWEQAQAAGLPGRVPGLLSALLPRSGPELTRDPLGLLFGAAAAGLGVLYFVVVLAGSRRRGRLGVLALAFAALVALPTALLVLLGSRTGVVRAQDPTVVQAMADSGRLAAARSPLSAPLETSPRGREAVSTSFRLEPPAELLPSRPLVPPGPSLLALLGRAVGLPDVRAFAVLALALLAMIVVASTAEGAGGPLLALVLSLPPLALGTVLGSPWALSLAALALAWAFRRQERPVASAVAVGVAAAADPLAIFPALGLVIPGPPRPRSRLDRRGPLERWRPALVAALAYAALLAPAVVPDPGAFVERLLAGRAVGPGLGFFNLVAYRGLEALAPFTWLAALAPLLTFAVAWRLGRSRRSVAARAALASLAALAMAPAVLPDAVAVPIVLLGLAAVEPVET